MKTNFFNQKHILKVEFNFLYLPGKQVEVLAIRFPISLTSREV